MIKHLLLILIFFIVPASAEIPAEIILFLENDTTDEHEYLPWYTCGHYSRDLARNATEYNLSIGSVILGNHPTLRGHQNHIMNYYIENGTIWTIEPQTDRIMGLNDTLYAYYRLYSDGTQVPTYWKHNFATEIVNHPSLTEGVFLDG